MQQAGQAPTFWHKHSAHTDEHIARGDAAVLQRLVRDHQAPFEHTALPGILEALHSASDFIASLCSDRGLLALQLQNGGLQLLVRSRPFKAMLG